MALISAPALKKRAGFFELEDIRHLDLSSLGVSSISIPPAALLQCVNLTVLSLRRNDVRACPWVSCLQQDRFKLEYAASVLQVKTIDGMEALAALEWLDLGDNKVANIAAISKLMKLEHLNLTNNAITDVKQLEHLRELASLRVLALGPGRSNSITVGDRHVQFVLEVVPALQILDGQFVAVIKVWNSRIVSHPSLLIRLLAGQQDAVVIHRCSFVKISEVARWYTGDRESGAACRRCRAG
jgi:Leucine-rich repeat (LRR) protein